MKKLVAVFTLFFLVSIKAFAAENIGKNNSMNDDVKRFVEEVGGKIINIAGKKNLSEDAKKDTIIKVIDDAIDPNWIARFVLGKNYRTSSDAQKERFTGLYRDFMINTYGPKFKNYNGRKFEVKNVTLQSQFFVAKAEFLPKNSNIPILVDFRVKERNNKLVILDFIAEGISLIETQRSEFNSAITQKGMDKFLDDLEVRVNNLKNNTKT